MKKLHDIKQIDFYESISMDNPIWGRPIENLFPKRFDKYCKIFHQFRLSVKDKIPNLDNWNFSDGEIIKFLIGENHEHKNALKDYELKPVKYLAQIYNEPFDKFFDTNKVSQHWKNNQPKWFLCPDTGTLDEKSCERLIKVLTPFTKDRSCYFHYVLYAINSFEETIFKGKLTELNDTLTLGFKGTPTKVWSEKMNWFIYTPYDCEFSIIAGEENIINSIFADNEIDAYQFDKDEILIPINN